MSSSLKSSWTSGLKSLFSREDDTMFTLDNPKKYMVVVHSHAADPGNSVTPVFQTDCSLWKKREAKWPTIEIEAYAKASSEPIKSFTPETGAMQELSRRSWSQKYTTDQHYEDLTRVLSGSVKGIKTKDIDTRFLSTDLIGELEDKGYVKQWEL